MEFAIYVLNRLFNFSLLGLGVYFIYMGDVIPRFQIGRTNFAVYQETMTELPTILTYVKKIPSNFTLGVDFNITLQGNILKLGQNHIGSDLKIYFEHVMSYQPLDLRCFRIRPLNFPLEVPHYYRLSYDFASSVPLSPAVTIYVTAENNSLGCFGGKHYIHPLR